MYLSAAADYSNLSDSELDAAYAAVYATVQGATGIDKVNAAMQLDTLTQEILTRLGSIWSFASGTFGHTRFPQYDAIQRQQPTGGFVQTQVAQTAVKQSAAAVGADIKKVALAGAGIGTLALLVAGLYLLRRK